MGVGGGGWGGVFSRIAGLGEGGGNLGGQGSELSRDPTTANAVAFTPQRGELLVEKAGPKTPQGQRRGNGQSLVNHQ